MSSTSHRLKGERPAEIAESSTTAEGGFGDNPALVSDLHKSTSLKNCHRLVSRLFVVQVNARHAGRRSLQEITHVSKRFILPFRFDQNVFEKIRVGNLVLFVATMRDDVVDKINLFFA